MFHACIYATRAQNCFPYFSYLFFFCGAMLPMFIQDAVYSGQACVMDNQNTSLLTAQ